MKHLFVPYQLALTLKGKGFDEPCIARYSPEGEFEMYRQDVVNNPYTYKNCYPSQTLAPTYQQAIDWLFTKDKIQIIEEPCWFYGIDRLYKVNMSGVNLSKAITLNDAIDKALQLIK